MTEKGSSSLANRLRQGHKIKLCRIETLQGAYLAWEAGIDFIGLHVIYRLGKRKQERLKKILDLLEHFRLRRGGAGRGPCVPILVTRSATPTTIASWCHSLNIHYVQLQNPRVTGRVIGKLRSKLRLLGDAEIEIIKTAVIRRPGDANACRKWIGQVEGLLYDSSSRGGSGERANWKLVRMAREQVPELPAFIAGGIRPEQARDAVESTNAQGVDVQTHCEVLKKQNKKSEKKVRVKKRKHIGQVLSLCSTVRGETKEQTVRRYKEHRADVRLLLSVADLEITEARRVIASCENLMIDGLQIDASDGTFVPEWEIGPVLWAKVAWSLAPEVPIWLHLFSKDWTYVHRVAASVENTNPHLVGIFLQCPRDRHPAGWLFELAQQRDGMPNLVLVPGFGAGQLIRTKREELVSSLGAITQKPRGLLLITAPSQERSLMERVRRTAQSLRIIHEITSNSKATWRVGIDRGVSLALLRRMRPQRPDFAVAGRGLVKGGLSSRIDGYRRALPR